MSNLVQCQLGEVIAFGNGKSRPAVEGKIPVYGGNGIMGYANTHNYSLETIVIGRVGAYCGATYYASQPIWVSDNALAAKPRNKNNAKYLFYFLRHLDLNQHAQGSSHPLVTQTLLNSIDVEIVGDPDEQRAIADVLSSLDDKIDLLHRQNKTLEALAETLFRQWFVEEASENWEEGDLGDYVSICYGKNLPTKDMATSGFPVFGANGQIGYHSEFNYETPQVLVSCRGEASGKVNFSLPYSFITNNSLALVRDKVSGFGHSHLKYWALSYDFQLHVSGSAQPQITIAGLHDAIFVLPPLQMVRQFEALADDVEVKMAWNCRQIRTLEKLRDTLLPKLMSGEVRVA